MITRGTVILSVIAVVLLTILFRVMVLNVTLGKANVEFVQVLPTQVIGQSVEVQCLANNKTSKTKTYPVTLEMYNITDKKLIWSLRQDVELGKKSTKPVVFNYINDKENTSIGQYLLKLQIWADFKKNKFVKLLDTAEKHVFLQDLTVSSNTVDNNVIVDGTPPANDLNNVMSLVNAVAETQPQQQSIKNITYIEKSLQPQPKNTIPIANAEVFLIYPEGNQYVDQPMEIWCDINNTGNTGYEFGVEIKLFRENDVLKTIEDKVFLDTSQKCRFKYAYKYSDNDLPGNYSIVARVKKVVSDKTYIVDQERKEFKVLSSKPNPVSGQ